MSKAVLIARNRKLTNTPYPFRIYGQLDFPELFSSSKTLCDSTESKILRYLKQSKHPPTDDWRNKMWYIHTTEYYSTLRRKTILTCAMTWMNLDDIMLSEISSHKRTDTVWFHLCEVSKVVRLGFPGGAVVENLPANAGDTGSSPGLGRSHMPRSD